MPWQHLAHCRTWFDRFSVPWFHVHDESSCGDSCGHHRVSWLRGQQVRLSCASSTEKPLPWTCARSARQCTGGPDGVLFVAFTSEHVRPDRPRLIGWARVNGGLCCGSTDCHQIDCSAHLQYVSLRSATMTAASIRQCDSEASTCRDLCAYSGTVDLLAVIVQSPLAGVQMGLATHRAFLVRLYRVFPCSSCSHSNWKTRIVVLTLHAANVKHPHL